MTSSERLTAIRVKPVLRSPVIVNLRNVYRPVDLAAKGLTYVSVGRG
jgi:UDPglucose 6-dehydrogenase